MDENKITYFAVTDTRNKRVPFGIKAKDRSRHMYVIGKTGMGKSTLLENMAIQDIQGGEGLAFIDPHGKTAELLLDYVPPERMKDVLYFAPFDMDYPISFNVMEDVGADKRHLVVSGLMSAFKKIWIDAWSARMEYILSNSLLALLEYPDATLLSVNRMLSDKDYRKSVVDNVKDPTVKSFWINEFGKYGERYIQDAIPPIQNKVGQFTANPVIRNIIGQPKSTFDLRSMMDNKKIIIVNLSKGRVGDVNANLLGSMFITKVYLAAMSRADLHESEQRKLPYFYFYVDEFQSFANESFASILSEARKYKLSLTMAHQYIEQMSEEVRAAVFGNVGTMVVFRVGAFDAEVLEKEFAPKFVAEDMVNLGFIQIYLKLMIDGVTSPPFSAMTLPPLPQPAHSYRDDIVKTSRAQFAQPRQTVEEALVKWHEPLKPAEKPRDQSSRPQENRDRPYDERGQSSRDFRNSNGRPDRPREMPRTPQDNRSSYKPPENVNKPYVKLTTPIVTENTPSSAPKPQVEYRTENRAPIQPPRPPVIEKFEAPPQVDIPLATDGFTSLKSISLETLKPKANFEKKQDERFNKGPQKNNLGDLKQALAGILEKEKSKQNNVANNEQPKIEKKSDAAKIDTAPVAQRNVLKKESEGGNDTLVPKVREVPEDVLKNVLNGDDNLGK